MSRHGSLGPSDHVLTSLDHSRLLTTCTQRKCITLSIANVMVDIYIKQKEYCRYGESNFLSAYSLSRNKKVRGEVRLSCMCHWIIPTSDFCYSSTARLKFVKPGRVLGAKWTGRGRSSLHVLAPLM